MFLPNPQTMSPMFSLSPDRDTSCDVMRKLGNRLRESDGRRPENSNSMKMIPYHAATLLSSGPNHAVGMIERY